MCFLGVDPALSPFMPQLDRYQSDSLNVPRRASGCFRSVTLLLDNVEKHPLPQLIRAAELAAVEPELDGHSSALNGSKGAEWCLCYVRPTDRTAGHISLCPHISSLSSPHGFHFNWCQCSETSALVGYQCSFCVQLNRFHFKTRWKRDI